MSTTGTPEWTSTEITHGRFKITNGEVTVEVFSDFSGNVYSADNSSVVQFTSLKDFIEAAKLLEQALVDHYGGYS